MADEKNKGKDEQNAVMKFHENAHGFFKELKGEYKKIIWPTFPELRKQTVTVIITAAIIGAIICGYDVIFSFAHEQLLTLLT